MKFWKRKKVQSTTFTALGLLVVVLVYLLVRGSKEEYVPGERTAGLTDSLGRSLPEDCPDVKFTDVAAAAGIDFTHFSGTRSNKIPEDMGSGVALGDVDGDGWVDVYLTNLAGPLDGRDAGWPDSSATCRMYRNRGDGTFEDLTDRAGLGVKDLVNGAAFLDHDGDGDLDLFVTSYGHCRLYRNDGAFAFADVSDESGVAAHEGFWTSVAIGDYDLDGAVDVYVCGYVQYREDMAGAQGVAQQYGTDIPTLLNPSTFTPEPNILLHNRGDGTFEEVAERLAVHNTMGRSLAATFADLTGDGHPDLYVANDVSDNVLFVNNGDGTFHDLTTQALIGDYRGAMGIAVGDCDGDQDQDLFITHWVGQENALYRNITADMKEEDEGKGKTPTVLFIDDADRLGLGQIALDRVGWATKFFDYDNDGVQDLFVTNGHTIPRRDNRDRLTPMKSQLFWNAGGKRGFYDMGAVAGEFFDQEWVGRGGAVFDYDLDGDDDLLIMRHGTSAVLLQNEGGDRGNSILVRLRQPEGNRIAIGSTIQVTAGGQAWTTQTDTQGSYLSQHAVGETAFGLGDVKQVDSIEVIWPDGTVESMGPCAAGTIIEWERGKEPVIRPYPGRGGASTSQTSIGTPGPTKRLDVAGTPDPETRRQFFKVLRQASGARIGGDLKTAEAHYRDALKLWPGHSDSQYYLANMVHEQGRPAEALELFQRIVEQDTSSSRAYMQLGRLQLPGGDPDLVNLEKAREAFQSALSINAEESGPVLALGLVELLAGHLEQAEELLLDAARLNSRSIESSYYRAWIAWKQGDRTRAEELLNEAKEMALPKKAGESTSNEGDTKQGGALLAQSVEESRNPLDRWRTLKTRDIDVETEFVALEELVQQQ